MKSLFDISGKVALVTGGSRGIGLACAQALGEAGANVVINYSTGEAQARETVAAIEQAGGTVLAVQANVAQQADIKRLFVETKQAYGQVDVLINNAGIYEFAPIGTITADHIRKQFALNVTGLILTTQDNTTLKQIELLVQANTTVVWTGAQNQIWDLNTHAAPMSALSLGPPIIAVLPSADNATA